MHLSLFAQIRFQKYHERSFTGKASQAQSVISPQGPLRGWGFMRFGLFFRRWHIHIPEDWVYGKWNQVNLYLVRVPRPVLRCLVCKELIKVIPSFLLQGTTLTLPALAFVIFAYETSYLAWRDLPEKFYDGKNKIAHSTLYVAAHSMGNLLKDDQILEGLRRRYLPSYKLRKNNSATIIEGNGWTLLKSLFPHTQTREKGTRRLIAELLPGKAKNLNFHHFFFPHIDNLNHIFESQ